MAARHPYPLLLALVGFALLALAGPLAGDASARGCGPSAREKAEDLSPGDARDAVVCLINKQRDKAGLADLDNDKRLQRAAQRHSDRMAGGGCFSHTCSGEPDLGGRLENVGYLSGGLSRWAYGENIAWGADEQGSPRAIVAAWMNSSGHRANILNRDFRDIGIGFAGGSPGSGRADAGTYTADFGLRVG